MHLLKQFLSLEYIYKLLYKVVMLWILLAISVQSYYIYKHFNEGSFKKSTPIVSLENDIFVDNVVNNVKIGKLAGNRSLAFGVKNILEEYLQEKGYAINETSPYRLKVEIIYLDVLTTNKNISVFHSNEEEVVIRLKGTLLKDGKKEKEVIAEESSSEISMSTLIVDEGGKFNQTSLSNALKKSCDKLVTKLLNK